MQTEAELAAWFDQRLPDEWFTDPATVVTDRDEILVTGDLADGMDPTTFRELTRERRMAIAAEAEAAIGIKVTWAVVANGVPHRYTAVSVPVMTRLHIHERRVLDTLIAGGIARSRSEALAWCVRLVAKHEGDWIAELAEAAEGIAEVRRRGPDAG